MPEKYDLKLPEGAVLDAAHLDQVAAFAKANGLSQDAAQKIVERDNATLAAYREKAVADWNAKTQAWLDASKTDKEIGGDKFDASVKVALDARNRFGTPELQKLLDETGAGNHPEFIRFFARVGQAMAPDRVQNPAQGGTGQSEQDVLQARYPSMFKS